MSCNRPTLKLSGRGGVQLGWSRKGEMTQLEKVQSLPESPQEAFQQQRKLITSLGMTTTSLQSCHLEPQGVPWPLPQHTAATHHPGSGVSVIPPLIWVSVILVRHKANSPPSFFLLVRSNFLQKGT